MESPAHIELLVKRVLPETLYAADFFYSAIESGTFGLTMTMLTKPPKFAKKREPKAVTIVR